MVSLPPQTLAFLAERAADKIIRDKAAAALDALDLTGIGAERVCADDLRQLFRKHPNA